MEAFGWLWRRHLWWLVLLLHFSSGSKNQSTIWLGTFFPSEGWSAGFECYPAVQIAVEEINNNTELLPNYHLSIMMNDTKCNARIAVEMALWQEIQHSLTGIIGAGCSVESVPIALLSSFYNIPQISYSSTSPELSDKDLYPYFSRVVPSDVFQSRCWIALLKYYGWNRIATLNSQETIHSLQITSFIDLLPSLPDVQILTSETFVGSQDNPDMSIQLQNIKKKGATIIFLACYEGDAAAVLHQASSMGMTSRSYVWVGSDSWFTDRLLSQLVSYQDILGAVGTNLAQANSTINQRFHAKYEALTSKQPGTYTVFTEYAYDSVYAMAYALHQLLEIDGFPYDPAHPSPNFGSELLSAIHRSNFSGASAGIVVLNEYGDRISAPYTVYDFRSSPAQKIIASAYWNPIGDTYTIISPVEWADGSTVVPLDHLTIQQYKLNIAIKVIMLTLAVLFIIFSLIFLALVIIWKDRPRVKAASFLFLAIILFASLLAYSAVIMISIEPVNKFTCIAPHWFGHIAFFLAFGSLFSKTFRVWQIFDRAKKLKVKVVTISDSMLLLIVLGFTLFGVAILSFFTAFESPVPNTRMDSADDTLQYIECQSPSRWSILTLILSEFLSLLFGVYLSFKTRKIELLLYNESTQIAVSIFALLFIGFIFIPIAYFLNDSLSPTLLYLITSAGLVCGTATFVMVLFVPKFRAILAGKQDSLDSDSTQMRTSVVASKQSVTVGSDG